MIDVYSYAMILYELVARKAVWEGLESALIVRRVKSGVRPEIEKVPSFQDNLVLTEIIVKSWLQDPRERLNFQSIYIILSEYIINLEHQ